MKTLYLSVTLIALFCSNILFGQPYLEWETSYTSNNPNGTDNGNIIVLDDDGNVYVGGKTAGTSNSDYLIIKFSPTGDTLWTRTFNGAGNGNDEILAIKVDFSGNVYVTGKSWGASASYDIATSKYGPNGNLIWTDIYNDDVNQDDYGNDLIADEFGNLYVCGSVLQPNDKAVILKYSPNGTKLWTTVLNNSETDACKQILISSNGNILVSVVDYFHFNTSATSFRILELNPLNGSVLRSYNNRAAPYFKYILGAPNKFILDDSGNIYVLSSALFGSNYEVYWSKYNLGSEGVVNYGGYGTPANSQGIDLVLDNDNNMYLLIDEFGTRHSHYIRKENFNNTQLWSRTFNTTTTSDDKPIGLKLSNKNENLQSIFVTGSNSIGNISLTNYSIAGDSLWTEFYDCGNNKADIAFSSITDNCDNIFITGYSTCNNTGQDVKVIKYSSLTKPTITASSQNPICEGDNIILYADTCSLCAYLWNNGSNVDSIIMSLDSTEEFQVTITDSDGCERISLPYKVVVKKLLKPEVTITSVTNDICVGSSTTITAQTVNAGSTPGYLWYINGSLQTNQNTSTLIVSPAINSQIHCILTTSEQCYTQQKDTSNVFTVAVNPLPIASITALGNTTFCNGSSVLLAPSQGTSYLWSNGSTADTLVVDKSGAYKVTLTDDNGCSNASNEIIVTVNDLPIANIMQSGSTTFCKGDSVILTASSASIYSWSTGATGNQIIVKNSGQFNVTVTDQNGCQAISQTINVTVHPLPTVSIISTGDLNFCHGESETLTSSTAGNLYKWSNGQTTPGITVNENGIYQLTITDANGCQGIASPVTISVFPLPTVSVNSSGPTTFCEGNNIILTASSASSYLWSNGTTTQTATINTTGSYSVTVTDENGCKNSSIPITINVNPLPMALISPSGNLHICAGDSVKLVATGGNQYLWSNTQTSKDIVVKESGNYQVTVTDNNGCFSMSLSTTIVVDSIPNVAIKVIGNLQFCDGDSVILEAYNAESYLWSNGANTQTITLKNNEIINVTGTNSFGCKSISTTYTTEKLPLVTPKVEITTPDLSVCEGASVSFNTNTINGGTEPTYQWFVNSMLQPDNSAVFSTNTLGNGSSVYCIMTSNEKCVTTQSDKSNVINIAVNALKTPTIEIIQESDVILECENGVFKAQITYGGNSPTYQWYVNDILTSTGPNLIYHEFITGDKVQCQLKSSAECLTANNILSNTIVANVINKELPIITIQNGTIKASNYSTNKFTYTWYLNGAPISTNESIECSDFGPGEYNLEVSINGCTFPSQSFQVENCTVGIDETNHSNQITIFPNPTRGVVQITSALTSEQQFDVKVINSLGITVFSQKVNTTGFLDISHLQNGIYILILNEQYVFKVIKI